MREVESGDDRLYVNVAEDTRCPLSVMHFFSDELYELSIKYRDLGVSRKSRIGRPDRHYFHLNAVAGSHNKDRLSIV